MRRLVVAAALCTVLSVTSSAHAAGTFCVHQTGGCPAGTTDESANLQQALTDAGNAGGGDVTVGAGTYDGGASGFTATGTGPIHITGAGPEAGGTILTADANVLDIETSAKSTVSQLAVQLDAAAVAAWGIVAGSADIDHVRVGGGGADQQAGVVFYSGSLSDSTVVLPTTASLNGNSAVRIVANPVVPVTLRRVSLTAITGVLAPGTSVHVFDARINASVTGVYAAGDSRVDDSLLTFPANAGFIRQALSAVYGTITARNDTIIGADSADVDTAAGAATSFSGNPASLVLFAVVAQDVGTTWRAEKSTASASIVVHQSDFPAGRTVTTGGGTVNVGDGNVDVDPGLVDKAGGDFHLRYDSPLVDAGGNCATACQEIPDLDGLPRPIDGNGDGIAVRDLGAYEYGARAPEVHAQADRATAAVGEVISYTATATDPDQGDALTYEWIFDDGQTATGPSVSHAFTNPGVLGATVKVTDPTHLVAADTATVTVTGDPTATTPGAPTPIVFPPGTFEIPPIDSGPTLGDIVKPVISSFRASHPTFKVSGGYTALSAAVKKRTPAGTTLSFSLSEPATVSIVLSRKDKVHGKTKLVKVGTLVRRNQVKGTNRIGFSGRLKSKKLKSASYVASITAKDAQSNVSSAKTVTLKIVSH